MNEKCALFSCIGILQRQSGRKQMAADSGMDKKGSSACAGLTKMATRIGVLYIVVSAIAVHIIGFYSSETMRRHCFKRLDALELAKTGNLKSGIDKAWGDRYEIGATS